MALPYPASGPTAITTQNLVPTGAATAGSAVELYPGTAAMMLVTVTGTYTGALSLQFTGDGSTWTTLSETCFQPVNGGAATATITSGATGSWRVPLSGYPGVRVTGLAAMTGTANVSLTPGNGGGISTDATPGTDQDVNLVGINGVTVVTGGVNGTLGVGGVAAAGTALASAGNPVLLAGSDGANTRRLLTDTSGNQFAKLLGVDGVTVAGTGNPVPVSTSAARPESSALQRPNDTTAYSQNDIIANSTTAGSVSYPTITVAAASGRPVRVWRIRLRTDKTSGWDATTFTVRLWSAAPTYTNGDNGAYAVATGYANQLAVCTISLAQFGDGASGAGVPTVGPFAQFLPATTLLYWDLQYTGSASLTPAAQQNFYLAAEVEQL